MYPVKVSFYIYVRTLASDVMVNLDVTEPGCTVKVCVCLCFEIAITPKYKYNGFLGHIHINKNAS